MNIVFFFNTSVNDPSFTDPTYRLSYERLSAFANLRNINILFVFGNENYHNGYFTTYYKFENAKLIRIKSNLYPDLVVPQTREHPEFKDRINNKFLEVICRDKYETAKTFNEFSKNTIILGDRAGEEIAQFNTEMIVVKPRYGALGKDINFIEKQFFNSTLYGSNYIAQEFIDSKEGIPGITNQRHELRLFIMNGIIKAAYLRLPAKNSYLANIAKGATAKQINLLDILPSAIELKNSVDNKFLDIKPRLYTIDVMFENKKPWIVELNDTPGMPDISVQPLTDDYLQALLNLFEERS